MTKTKIRRNSLTEEVYRYLRRAVMSGELPDGSPLTEEKISADLGISRTPVREALLRLAAEELVDSERGRTPVVRAISRHKAMDLLDAYIAIARPTYALGGARLSAEDLAAIEESVDRFEHETIAGDEQGAMYFLGQAFNRVFEASGNPVLIGMIKSLQPRDLALLVSLRYPQGLHHDAVDVHREELAALRAGDIDGALAVFERSWAAMSSSIAAAFASDLTSAASSAAS